MLLCIVQSCTMEDVTTVALWEGKADQAVLTGVYIMVLFHRLGSNPIFFGSISNSNSNYMFMYNDYHAFEQYKEY